MAKKSKLNHASLLANKKFAQRLRQTQKEYFAAFSSAPPGEAGYDDPANLSLTNFITGHYVTTRTAGAFYSTLWGYWYMRRALMKKANRSFKPQHEFDHLKEKFDRADRETKRTGGIIRTPKRRDAEVAADEHIHALELQEPG